MPFLFCRRRFDCIFNSVWLKTEEEKEMRSEMTAMIREIQQTEITEYLVYSALAEQEKGANRDILKKIAEDEHRHYKEWEKILQQGVKPRKLKVAFYLLVARIFGITFAIKMMENGEKSAEKNYEIIGREIPIARELRREEMEHEHMLVNMINEEKIAYIGSMVLGLNDALVELTGALAGLTLALQHARLIAIAGLITGIAASLSMAASEYLSQKSEKGEQSPGRAAVYTGIAYIVTVVFLIFPYFIFHNPLHSLGFTVFNAFLVILIFTFYISVVKEEPFKKLFSEMLLVSFGVALVTFGIGWVTRQFLNVDL